MEFTLPALLEYPVGEALPPCPPFSAYLLQKTPNNPPSHRMGSFSGKPNFLPLSCPYPSFPAPVGFSHLSVSILAARPFFSLCRYGGICLFPHHICGNTFICAYPSHPSGHLLSAIQSPVRSVPNAGNGTPVYKIDPRFLP